MRRMDASDRLRQLLCLPPRRPALSEAARRILGVTARAWQVGATAPCTSGLVARGPAPAGMSETRGFPFHSRASLP
jgi:hypothetical protein